MKISVNLRPGAKRGAKPPGVSMAATLERLKGLGGAIKDPLRLGAIVVWVVVLAGLLGGFLWTGSRLGALEPRVQELLTEQSRYADFLAQKRAAEASRDSIMAQVRTIQAVDRERFVWPHILDEVAQAVPQYTWLIEVAPAAPTRPQQPARGAAQDTTAQALTLQISGRTMDIQGYTRLMRNLEDSPFLGGVQAVSANTIVERGRALTAFVLQARYTAPPAEAIRTVPVGEPVVER